MFVYLFLFLGFSILYFKPVQNPKLGFYIFFGFAILVAGFRDMIGGFDVYIYSEVFERTNLIEFAERGIFEPGFIAYYWVLKQVNETREWMLLVSSVLVLGGHFYAFKKLSPLIYISLFIYFAKFYLMSFVYIRQGMAMMIAWIAFVYLSKQKYKWKWLLAIAAVFMHKSAIIILPFLLIASRKLSLFQIFGIAILTLGISLTPISELLFDTAVQTIDNEKLESYNEKTGVINLFYLIEGVLVIVLVLKYRAQFYADKTTKWILNGLFFYGLIILLSLGNATFIRFGWYFFIFVVIGLPYILQFNRGSNSFGLYRFLIFLYYTAVFLRLLLVYDGGDFMPYKSIFQDFDRNGMWEHLEYR